MTYESNTLTNDEHNVEMTKNVKINGSSKTSTKSKNGLNIFQMILKDNSPMFISSPTNFMDTNKKYLLIMKDIYRGDIVLK